MDDNDIVINTKKYKIIKELGQGNFGKVFHILDYEDNKEYAIKKIPLKDKGNEEINDIKNEANILSSINNKNIIKYYNSYQDNKSFYILMEFCNGSDLRKLINDYKKKEKSIEQNSIFNIVLSICSGIKEIHEKKIVHRDLKPENIFVTLEKEIKIGDFGVSKQLLSNKAYASTKIGTYYYMAPELLNSKKYNNKVDIWAFGCIIYELLTLNYCFENENLFGLFNQIINEKHGTIDINKYSPKWQRLIDLLLAKDYKERPDINEVYNYLNNEFKDLYSNQKNNNEIIDNVFPKIQEIKEKEDRSKVIINTIEKQVENDEITIETFINNDTVVKDLIYTKNEKYIMCSICSNILIEPFICSNCHYIYCKKCKNEWSNCKNCKKSNFQTNDFINDILSELKIKCLNCSENICYYDIKNHYITNHSDTDKKTLNFFKNFKNHEKIKIKKKKT